MFPGHLLLKDVKSVAKSFCLKGNEEIYKKSNKKFVPGANSVCVSKTTIIQIHSIWFSYFKLLRFLPCTTAAHICAAKQNINNKANTFTQIKIIIFKTV